VDIMKLDQPQQQLAIRHLTSVGVTITPGATKGAISTDPKHNVRPNILASPFAITQMFTKFGTMTQFGRLHHTDRKKSEF